MNGEDAMRRMLAFLQAHAEGHAALVACEEKSTGKVVMLACIVTTQSEGTALTPIAKVFSGGPDPFDDYTPLIRGAVH